MSIVIEPLSPQTLKTTISLTDKVFLYQRWWEKASWAFSLSLMSGFFPKLLLNLVGVHNCHYWVALNSQQEVIGVTGLYQVPKDAHAYWLGWTCVDPDVRGQGVGKQLINFAIDTAKISGISYLRLYTSDLPDYAIAVQLYERLGFELTSQVKAKHHHMLFNILHYQLNLNEL
jgi:GNAT superfamily N-acetyltransferase